MQSGAGSCACYRPKFGCGRIAQQITRTFGVEIDKDVVRRVLAKYYWTGGVQRSMPVAPAGTS